MKKIVSIFTILVSLTLFCAQSVIIETEGIASMGDTKSKKETMGEANKAAEFSQNELKIKTMK